MTAERESFDNCLLIGITVALLKLVLHAIEDYYTLFIAYVLQPSVGTCWARLLLTSRVSPCCRPKSMLYFR